MEKNKGRKNKRKYLDDFKINDIGKYEYSGKTYAFSGGKKSFEKALLNLWISAIVIFISAGTAGCFPVESMKNSPYVIIPYVLMLVSTALFIFSLGKVTFAAYPLREYIYKQVKGNLPSMIYLSLISSVLVILMQLLFIVLNGTDKYSFLFIGLCFVSVLFSLNSVRQIKKMSFEEIKGSEYKSL